MNKLTFIEEANKELPSNINPLSANFTRMVKPTQTIRRQIADELFECV